MDSNLSPWIDQLKNTTKSNTFIKNLKCDFLVIGAGISGITTAYYLLKNTNKKVILVEAKKLASGATGHNAGQMVSYFERQISSLEKEYGFELAVSAQKDINSAWFLIEEIFKETGITTKVAYAAGFVGIQSFEDLIIHLQNALIYNKSNLPFEKLSIADDSVFLKKIPSIYDGLYNIIPKQNLLDFIESKDKSYQAMITGRKGVMNSALFCEDLLDFINKNYSERFMFFENSPIEEIRLKKDLVRSKILNYYALSQKVILCTNGFENIKIKNLEGDDIDSKFHYLVKGSIGYMAGYLEKDIKEPTAVSFLPKQSSTGNEAFDSDPYFYLTRRDFEINSEKFNLICVGGPESLLDDTNNYIKEHPYPKEAQGSIDKFIHSTYRYSPEGEIDYKYKWHGLMGYTPNGLRLIGPEPLNQSLLYNLGCNGVGILPSVFGSYKISRILAGDKFPKSLFDPVDYRQNEK